MATRQEPGGPGHASQTRSSEPPGGGTPRPVHAGESSGPEGVWDALEFLHAERIDHGVRAIEDPRLVQELATRGIPLDVCPGSNVKLGLYSAREQHPLDALRQAGVRVSIN